jgi:hypothetical protein
MARGFGKGIRLALEITATGRVLPAGDGDDRKMGIVATINGTTDATGATGPPIGARIGTEAAATARKAGGASGKGVARPKMKSPRRERGAQDGGTT